MLLNFLLLAVRAVADFPWDLDIMYTSAIIGIGLFRPQPGLRNAKLVSTKLWYESGPPTVLYLRLEVTCDRRKICFIDGKHTANAWTWEPRIIRSDASAELQRSKSQKPKIDPLATGQLPSKAIQSMHEAKCQGTWQAMRLAWTQVNGRFSLFFDADMLYPDKIGSQVYVDMRSKASVLEETFAPLEPIYQTCAGKPWPAYGYPS